MKLGFLTRLPAPAQPADIAAWPPRRLRGARVAAGRRSHRPFTATHLDVTSYDREACSDCSPRTGTLSSLAFYDTTSTRPEERAAIGSTCCAASTPRPTWAARPWGPSSAGPRAVVCATTCPTAETVFAPLVDRRREGREVIVGELRDGGVAPDGYPGNLAYSPELWEWMFSIGSTSPTTLAPCVDRDRPRHRVRAYLDASPQPRPRTSSCFPSAATATALRQGVSCATTRGTWAGGATASPAPARSTGTA